MIDQLLDDLFEVLFLGPQGPLVSSRMSLRPPAGAASHFIAAPRPTMSRQDMARIDEQGLLAELGVVFDDLPADRRDEVLGLVKAIVDALAQQAADDGPAEPPSLIYALH